MSIEISVLKNMLLEGITSGVLENDVTRDFDILDYYRYTNIPIDKIVKLLDGSVGLTSSERKILSPFATKFTPPKMTSVENFIKTIMGEKLVIGGVEISKELKEEALSYLIENQTPINIKTYLTYLRRTVALIKEEVTR